MDTFHSSIGRNNKKDICLLKSVTIHIILKNERYFSYLMMKEANVIIISYSTKLIEGFKRSILLLPGETALTINDTLYCSKFQRNLQSFKDIRQNYYHVETINEGKLNIFILLQ